MQTEKTSKPENDKPIIHFTTHHDIKIAFCKERISKGVRSTVRMDKATCKWCLMYIWAGVC